MRVPWVWEWLVQTPLHSVISTGESSMSATVNVTAKITNIKVAPGREKFEDAFTNEMLFSQNLKKEKEFNRQIKKKNRLFYINKM